MKNANRPLNTPTRAVMVPAHWIGKPMHSLRLRTIFANVQRTL